MIYRLLTKICSKTGYAIHAVLNIKKVYSRARIIYYRQLYIPHHAASSWKISESPISRKNACFFGNRAQSTLLAREIPQTIRTLLMAGRKPNSINLKARTHAGIKTNNTLQSLRHARKHAATAAITSWNADVFRGETRQISHTSRACNYSPGLRVRTDFLGTNLKLINRQTSDFTARREGNFLLGVVVVVVVFH